jgi:hypothetical protein
VQISFIVMLSVVLILLVCVLYLSPLDLILLLLKVSIMLLWWASYFDLCATS